MGYSCSFLLFFLLFLFLSFIDKIQRALGQYLERQRTSFPRFYFVGDEDLLEIIGNSKDPMQVQRHVNKMFAAISNLEIDSNKNKNIVLGMSSKEGEIVMYDTVINVLKNPKINEWLSAVENQMQRSLATLLENALSTMPTTTTAASSSSESSSESESGSELLEWIHQYPAQIVLLASAVGWSTNVEKALSSSSSSPTEILQKNVLDNILSVLTLLADRVLLAELSPSRRKMYEQSITEYVHSRDSTRRLIEDKVISIESFGWTYQLRYYWRPNQTNLMERLSIQIANASFNYGFEYLGVAERLVQTPLTDRCYLTLTQALNMRMGGNPFGPAGTGKTESVKMLGAMLGRFVLGKKSEAHWKLFFFFFFFFSLFDGRFFCC